MTDAIQMPAPAMTVPAYTVTARVLHWIIAALVLIMIPLGIVIANEWGGPWQTPLYNLHKSLGALILPLVVVRLIWRLTHPPAPLPADVPPIQQFAAHATHWTLYALLIAQPLIGWIATSAYPAPLPVFGLFELPKIWRGRPAVFRAAVRRAPMDGHRPRRCGGDAYRCRPSPPFRAQGPGSHAHAHGLIAAATPWPARHQVDRSAN